jgi:hypothetical protein
MNVEAITEAVRRFRTALERCHEELGLTFRSFPKDCCGDVSELLAAFLKDEGFGEFALVSGWRSGSDQSHAWLEKNGLIIDVTADQFEDGAGLVMINEDLTWHAQFGDHRERRDDGDFRTEHEPVHLSLAYEKVRQWLA